MHVAKTILGPQLIIPILGRISLNRPSKALCRQPLCIDAWDYEEEDREGG